MCEQYIIPLFDLNVVQNYSSYLEIKAWVLFRYRHTLSYNTIKI